MIAKLFEKFATKYFHKLLVIAGFFIFYLSFIFGRQDLLFNGYRILAMGVIFLGVGEWLNHPLQVSLLLVNENSSEVQKKNHHRRNPSTLGNLFEIAALILICIGISKAFLN